MTRNLEFECFVGVDVSEARLDVHLLPGGERASFGRDRRSIARLVAWLARRTRLLVVIEATGGLERMLAAALAQAAIAVAVVNPRQVRRIGVSGHRRRRADGRSARLMDDPGGAPEGFQTPFCLVFSL